MCAVIRPPSNAKLGSCCFIKKTAAGPVEPVGRPSPSKEVWETLS